MKILWTAPLFATALLAHEYGPNPRYTGAPGDYPLACATSMCHTDSTNGGPLNVKAGYGVSATFSTGSSYTPGGPPITIVVTVTDPVNTHYGFQMTARLESDLSTDPAGDFNTGTTSSCPPQDGGCEVVICDDGSVKFPNKICVDRSTGKPTVEFIEHMWPKNSQVSTTPYMFTWTPPKTNVGRVHFYVAGNSDNGDLMANGADHISTAEYTLTPVLCSGKTPAISAVISAGAYGQLPMFASGSWVEIYGSNFASDTWQWAGPDFNGANAPTSLAGVSVTVNSKPAYIWFLNSGQVNVQAPDDSATGNVPIVVSSCGTASSPFMLQKTALAPGFLSPSSYLVGGKQYLLAQFQDQTFVGDPTVLAGTSRPAKPGDLLIVFGIGFGEADDGSGPIPPGVIAPDVNTLKNPFSISFGSAQASLVYDGLAPGFVGLYQFDVTVPNVPNGITPLNIMLNGAPISQQLYLAIKN